MKQTEFKGKASKSERSGFNVASIKQADQFVNTKRETKECIDKNHDCSFCIDEKATKDSKHIDIVERLAESMQGTSMTDKGMSAKECHRHVHTKEKHDKNNNKAFKKAESKQDAVPLLIVIENVAFQMKTASTSQCHIMKQNDKLLLVKTERRHW